MTPIAITFLITIAASNTKTKEMKMRTTEEIGAILKGAANELAHHIKEANNRLPNDEGFHDFQTCGELQEIAAQLAAAAPVVVPSEPTEAQIKAMCDVRTHDGHEPRYWRDSMVEQYRAAIKAAPGADDAKDAQ